MARLREVNFRDPLYKLYARRLLASIDRLEHGGGIERDLLE